MHTPTTTTTTTTTTTSVTTPDALGFFNDGTITYDHAENVIRATWVGRINVFLEFDLRAQLTLDALRRNEHTFTSRILNVHPELTREGATLRATVDDEHYSTVTDQVETAIIVTLTVPSPTPSADVPMSHVREFYAVMHDLTNYAISGDDYLFHETGVLSPAKAKAACATFLGRAHRKQAAIFAAAVLTHTPGGQVQPTVSIDQLYDLAETMKAA